MLIRICTTNKEIPEFPCLVGRQGCAASAKGRRLWSEALSFQRTCADRSVVYRNLKIVYGKEAHLVYKKRLLYSSLNQKS